jgi:hypothetical protein
VSSYTDFKSTNPFYGGISPNWGTGLHEDFDPVTEQKELIKADYLNRIENRIDRLENIFNQLESEIIYPSGTINTDGIEDESISEDVPASGEYYLTSRLDLLASGINALIDVLLEGTVIESGDVPFYPFYVGEIVES